MRPVYNRPQGPFQDSLGCGDKPVDPVETSLPKSPLFEEKTHAAELGVAGPPALVGVSAAHVNEGFPE